jgi:hypothetical protein
MPAATIKAIIPAAIDELGLLDRAEIDGRATEFARQAERRSLRGIRHCRGGPERGSEREHKLQIHCRHPHHSICR